MNVVSIGDSVKRKEDFRFITGKGRYVDDMNKANQLYAYFVRSSYPHAVLKSVDKELVLSNHPDVQAVYSGEDVQADGLGGLPCGWQVHSKDGSPMKEPLHPVIATDKVRYVGEVVAVIIANSYQAAKDAAQEDFIEYDELESVSFSSQSLENKNKIHNEADDNLCFDWEIGSSEEIDKIFAQADHVTKLSLKNNRLIPNAIEPRAAIGDYDQAHDSYSLTTTTQNPHLIRLLMGAYVLNLPEHKIQVLAPDVGGGFGSKIYHYAEEAIVTWAAKKLNRPVKWTAERSESFISDAHGRDHETEAELALDSDGKFIGLRVHTLANLGAYLSTFAACVPTYLHATLLAGCYTTPSIYCNVKGVFTNTVPVDAYRGAGRPEATYILERLVEKAASELNMDPAALRMKNFIQPDQYPYQTPVALEYDNGDYPATLKKALQSCDYDGFEERQKESLSRGKYRGIGFSTYIEACGIAPSAVAGALGARAGLYESASIRVHPTGSVTVYTGTHSHGQGHETTFSQLIADRFGIDYHLVEIVHGDTNKIPFGMGTYGSRSLAVGGSAISQAADKIIQKGKIIAAHLFDVSEDDVEFTQGLFKARNTNQSKSFQEIALAAYVPHDYPHEKLEPGLEETSFYDPKNFTYPAGAHICEVEVDPETGVTEIMNFVVVDDFGNIINPMIVEGQVHGGLAQGIGQALFENCVYDDYGQLLSGSYMDYTMPRALNLTDFTVETNVTPCLHNPLGVKGCGEAGAIGSPPAVMNAILNALKPLGVQDIEMPATSYAVWTAIQNSQQQKVA